MSCRHVQSSPSPDLVFHIEANGPAFPRGGTLAILCTVTNTSNHALECAGISGRSVLLHGEIPPSLYAIEHWWLCWHTLEELTLQPSVEGALEATLLPAGSSMAASLVLASGIPRPHEGWRDGWYVTAHSPGLFWLEVGRYRLQAMYCPAGLSKLPQENHVGPQPVLSNEIEFTVVGVVDEHGDAGAAEGSRSGGSATP